MTRTITLGRLLDRFNDTIASDQEPGTPDPADAGEPVSEPPKTFTQDQLEHELGKRLARERAKYTDYDDLKAKATKFDEIEAANQSELDKATARAEDAERRVTQATARATASAIRAAVVAEATRAKAINPDDVVAVLAPDAVTVADDGTVDGVAEAVKAILDARPHWVHTQPTQTQGEQPGRQQGTFDNGAGGDSAVDYRNADKQTFDNALASYGLRPRS